MSKNKRKQYVVDMPFQSGFILKFVIIVIVSSGIIALAILLSAQDSTTVAIDKARVLAKPTADFILPTLSFIVVLVIILSAIVVTLVTLLVSHRIAGPIFRLKKELSFLREGNLKRNFTVREKDEFKDLAQALQETSNTLYSRHEKLKSDYNKLLESLSPSEKERLKGLLNDIKTQTDYFKV